MNDMMTFPNTWEEFERVYGITDREEIYTNGARLIPSFRVKQWLDHIAELEKHTEERAETHACDLIDRQVAITQLSHNKNKGDDEWELAVENDIQTIWNLPPAQPKVSMLTVTVAPDPEDIERVARKIKDAPVMVLPSTYPDVDMALKLNKAYDDGYETGYLQGKYDWIEKKKGRWNFIGNQMFECTECGVCYTQSQFNQMRVRITDSISPNFCPSCGADMREVTE